MLVKNGDMHWLSNNPLENTSFWAECLTMSLSCSSRLAVTGVERWVSRHIHPQKNIVLLILDSLTIYSALHKIQDKLVGLNKITDHIKTYTALPIIGNWVNIGKDGKCQHAFQGYVPGRGKKSWKKDLCSHENSNNSVLLFVIKPSKN